MKRIRYLNFIATLLLFLYFSTSIFGQEKELKFNYEEKRDPFIPLVDESGNLRKNFKKPQFEELPAKVSLQGISNVKGVFYAIIDGELLKEGDMAGELKIEKIESNRVILCLGDKRFELILETEKK